MLYHRVLQSLRGIGKSARRDSQCFPAVTVHLDTKTSAIYASHRGYASYKHDRASAERVLERGTSCEVEYVCFKPKLLHLKG